MTNIKKILEKTLLYSKRRGYKGYDKGDGMSAEILNLLPFDNKWFNIFIQESIKRFPINIRPILKVPKYRNFKGIALFTMANKNMYDYLGKDSYLLEAKNLADWLLENQCKGYNGFCGAYKHAWQNVGKKIPPNTPGIVNTSYGAKALLQMGEEYESYDKTAKTAAGFLFEDLNYHECEEGARINYKVIDSGESYTINANALGARLLIDIFSKFPQKKYKEASTKILEYVVSNQTDQGGWMYTDPSSASHLNMDNYHNGFIIESLLRYQEITGSNRYEDSIKKALHFYKKVLYNKDGSPNWDEKNKYPKDIHGAAQGIITFTEAGDTEFAKKIIDWTIDNLYAGNGQFYYQKCRLYTKKFTLMRWCQAWMAYALSEYLKQNAISINDKYLDR